MRYIHLCKIILFMLLLSACHDDFLDKKRRKADVVPESLQDFRALLDNHGVMNGRASSSVGLIGSDDYFLLDEIWNNLFFQHEKDAYIWSDNIFINTQSDDWNHGYKKILYANIVLEGLDKIGRSASNQEEWDSVKGSALYFRALTLYQLAQLFCKPYEKETAGNELGLPLRTESDINVSYNRSTLEETYQFIINDLTNAFELLPMRSISKYRPSGEAVYPFFARVYLQMGDYDAALKNAESSLQHNNELIDFNTLDQNTQYPFPLLMQDNSEVIFVSHMAQLSILTPPRLNVDTVLYSLYEDTDLRKKIYFDENDKYMTAKGGLADFLPFTGFFVSEMHLIKAECLARAGDISGAANALHELLSNRYETGATVPEVSGTDEAVLTSILRERRKELFYKGGLRWEDLRRLNRDPRFAKDIIRKVGGQTYTLPANDPKYTWLIPDDVIRASNIQQNER